MSDLLGITPRARFYAALGAGAAYSFVCGVACTEPHLWKIALGFAGLTLFTVIFTCSNMLAMVFISILVTPVLAAIGVAFPPLAFLLPLWALYVLTRKAVLFIRRLPFAAMSAILGGYVLAIHKLCSRVAISAHDSLHQALWIIAAAVGGALIVVLLGYLGELVGPGFSITVIYAVGYTWYLAVFALTFFLPDDTDADGDEIEWGI